MSKLLLPEEVEKKLESLPLEWSVISGTLLQRNYSIKSMEEGAGFVARIAKIADNTDHHPEIVLKWRSVDILITTHSLGGLTAADFHLAAEVEKCR